MSPVFCLAQATEALLLLLVSDTILKVCKSSRIMIDHFLTCSFFLFFFSFGVAERKGLTSVLDHATGEEKEELLADLEGKELYEQYLSGPFGTMEKPVIVPSVFHTRIIGCVGKLIDRKWNALLIFINFFFLFFKRR